MDDLPDKLRRNVVVLSAAIVAITVFHLSFAPTGTLLGFAKVGNVTPVKVWLALTAALVYMALRYRFHDETEKDLRALVEQYKGARYAAIRRLLTADVQAYLLRRRARPRWTEGFAATEDDIFAQAYTDFGGPTAVDLVSTVEHQDDSPWSGHIGFSIEIEWPGGQRRGVSGDRRHAYKLPRCLAIRIALGTALRTALYSKSSVDVLVPIGLAALAASMCVFQLLTTGVTP